MSVSPPSPPSPPHSVCSPPRPHPLHPHPTLALTIVRVHAMQILGAAACLGMRESPSLTSLVDLVKNTSSTSLVDMINYSYSSTNLDGMDEAQH